MKKGNTWILKVNHRKKNGKNNSYMSDTIILKMELILSKIGCGHDVMNTLIFKPVYVHF